MAKVSKYIIRIADDVFQSVNMREYEVAPSRIPHFVENNLTPGACYWAKVRARRTDGSLSDWSNIAKVCLPLAGFQCPGFTPYYVYDVSFSDRVGDVYTYGEPSLTLAGEPGQHHTVMPGDIQLIFIETGEDPISITNSSAWTPIPNTPILNLDGTPTKLSGFWRRFTSPVTLPFIEFTVPNHAVSHMVFIRGAVESGNPFDVTSDNFGTGASIIVPNITTTVDNCLVIAVATAPYGEFGSLLMEAGTDGYLLEDGSGILLMEGSDTTGNEFTSWVSPDLTNFKERVDTQAESLPGNLSIATGEKNTAGAVNSTTVNQDMILPWNSWIGAVKPRQFLLPLPLDIEAMDDTAPFGQTEENRDKDIALLFVETSNEAVTVSAPVGWTEAPNSPVIRTGTNPTRLTVFWKRLTSASEVYPTVTGYGDHATTKLFVLRGVLEDVDPFEFTATADGEGTLITVPGGGTTSTKNTISIVAVASSSSGSGGGDVLNTIDDFDDNVINPALWTITNGTDVTVTESGQQLRFDIDSSWSGLSDIGNATSVLNYNFTDTIVQFDIISVVGGDNPDGESHFSVRDSAAPVLNRTQVDIYDSTLGFRTVDGGFSTDSDIPWSPTITKIRIAHNNTTGEWLFYTYSSGVWTLQATHASSWVPTSSKIIINSQLYGNAAESQSFVIDNVGTITTSGATSDFGHFSDWVNGSLIGFSPMADVGTASGDGGRLAVAVGNKASLGIIGPTTLTQPASSEWVAWTGTFKAKVCEEAPTLESLGIAPNWLSSSGNPDGSPAPTVTSYQTPQTFTDAETWDFMPGDIVVLFLESTDEVIPTPAGWQEAPNSPVVNTDAPRPTKLTVFWKRLEAPIAPPYALVTGAPTGYFNGPLFAFRGAVETGDPWDITYNHTETGTTITIPGGETTNPDTFVVACIASSTGSSDSFSNWENDDLYDFREIWDFISSGFFPTPKGVAIAAGTKFEAGAFGPTVVKKVVTGPCAAWVGVLKRNETPVKPYLVQAPSHLSQSATFGAVTVNPLTINRPQRGDLVLTFHETDNLPITVAFPPANWQLIPSTPVNNGGTTRVTGYWTRVTDTDELNPILNQPSTHAVARILGVRGCVTTGDPWDTTATNTGTGTSLTIPGLTTTGINEFIVSGVGCNAASTTLSAWTNAALGIVTERFDAGTLTTHTGRVAAATGVKGTAGAFGNTTATQTIATDYVAWSGALKPANSAVAPTFAGANTQGTTFPDMTSVWPPAETLPDDILVMFVESGNETMSVIYEDDGWQEAPNSPVLNGNTKLTVFWKRATGYAFSRYITDATPASGHQMVVSIVRNADESANPFDVSANTTGGTGTTVTLPGATTTVDNCLVLNVVGSNGTGTASFLRYKDWTNADLHGLVIGHDRVGGGALICITTAHKLTAGTYGSTVGTVSTSVTWCGLTVAIKPKTY